jgi:hypothetical protein
MSKRRSKSEIVTHLLCKSGGLRSRVDSNCVNCTYDELEPGTWRQQVAGCTVSSCALWEVRAKSKYTVDIGGTTPETHVMGQGRHANSPASTGSLQMAKKIGDTSLIGSMP